MMKPTEAAVLASLLTTRPIAALATLHNGEPAVSMVPFAMLPAGDGFVVHVSRLASHTADMLASPAVALLVTGAVSDAETPLAVPRVSIQGCARQCLPDADEYASARSAYLTKLPDAGELFSFTDFSLFLIEPVSLRYVAGFGRAMSLDAAQLRSALERQS